MESLKKILPYLLIAIVFVVAGYFIGKGAAMNQAASLYTTIRTNSQYTAGNVSTDDAETISRKKCEAKGGQYLKPGHCFEPAPPIKDALGNTVPGSYKTLADCIAEKGQPVWSDSAKTRYVGCITSMVGSTTNSGTPAQGATVDSGTTPTTSTAKTR